MVYSHSLQLVTFAVHMLHASGNMMLFDRDGKIKHYETPEAIMSEFFDVRLDFYERRRLSMLQVRLHCCQVDQALHRLCMYVELKWSEA